MGQRIEDFLPLRRHWCSKESELSETSSRIQTYGNSFTHCDQVNDGETWARVSRRTFGESIENFGVGGYSVYQAYLRMRKVEKTIPPNTFILNIYDDDHFRNFDCWRMLAKNSNAREQTLPSVRDNVSKNETVELPKLCPTHTTCASLWI